KNQKTVLSNEEEQRIIDTVNLRISDNGFSVVKTFDEIKETGYSFNPGSYFDLNAEINEMSVEQFSEKILKSKQTLMTYFEESKKANEEIISALEAINYDL
ncbi:MAG: SAM-dependent methyltransferase, partial [Oscillospiraceae bacterium]|nr:SAM-dependent methyltransferase [Oscillospiraceae bacterium]